MFQRFFADDTMQFETELALGQVRSGLTEPGEVLATISAIQDGDRPSWVVAWSQLASRLEQAGDEAGGAEHEISARDLWLRASNAWNKASFLADGGDDPAALAELWGRHRRLWERAAPLLPVPAEPITVPFERHQLEAFLWRPEPGAPARRTLIMNNGSDGPVTDMWYLGAADALERGWNVVTFDGPGQNATLHRLGVGFRPDWHVVIAAVLDRLAGVQEVDPERIALLGNSQGGYWAPQAATVEHRIAAVVADPGVVDVSASWFEHLPADMAQLLDDPDGQAPFDELMAAGMQADANLRATIRVPGAPVLHRLAVGSVPVGAQLPTGRGGDRAHHVPRSR